MSSEPETWLGNVLKWSVEIGTDESQINAEVREAIPDGPMIPMSEFTLGPRVSYCNRCGNVHAAGECKRGDR